MIKRWINISTNKSLILTGIRRAGKTTLVKYQYPNALYLTLDDFDNLTAAEDDPKSLFEGLTSNQIIIDEVQRVPKLLIAVKDQIDNYNRQVIMTGSSTLGLLSSGSETLAGRIKLLDCPTLCFGENAGSPIGKSFSDKMTIKQIKGATRKFNSWIEYGGFPEIVSLESPLEKKETLHDYKNTFFTKDILLLSNIENARGLLGCLYYLGVSTGSRIEISSVAKESGLSYPTVKKYLNALEAARMTIRITGYQYGPAKRQLKSNKYYFSDISIPNALSLRLSEGQLFELFVISELEKRRKLGRFACDFFYFYESEKGKEIDLIIDEGDTVTAIEIKNTKNPNHRDITNLKTFTLKKKAKLRKILICKSDSFKTIEDVEVWPVYSLYRHI